MIGGAWGIETNSVTVKGLLPFFQNHHRDQIIAIVPIHTLYQYADLMGVE